VSLVSDGGHRVGDVSTYAGPPTWIFLRLDEHGGDSGAYQCVIDLEGGRTIALGAMWVSGGHGGWGERVGVDTSEVRAARLVDQSGATIATATFR
jgi:hypothetical protein